MPGTPLLEVKTTTEGNACNSMDEDRNPLLQDDWEEFGITSQNPCLIIISELATSTPDT